MPAAPSLALGHPFRKRGCDHDHTGFRAGTDAKSGLALRQRRFRLLPVNDAVAPSEAGHQMLGALEHEVPPQMGKADQGIGMGKARAAPIRRENIGHLVQNRKTPVLERQFKTAAERARFQRNDKN
jgi:hypothetical protein